jgi:hypothetical protein
LFLVKVDDDVVYVDVLKFGGFVDAIWEQPDVFLWSANVINNGKCAYYQQQRGVIPMDVGEFENPTGIRGTLHGSGKKALRLHEYFVTHREQFTFDNADLQIFQGRLSINFVAFGGWQAEEVQRFTGMKQKKSDDEYSLTTRANLAGKKEVIYMPLVAAHATFYSQVNFRPQILALYENFAMSSNTSAAVGGAVATASGLVATSTNPKTGSPGSVGSSPSVDRGLSRNSTQLDHDAVVLFCGPAQSSTLLTGVFLSVLRDKGPACMHPCGGAHEHLNPMCVQTCKDSLSVRRCLGAEGKFIGNIWTPSCGGDWNGVIDFANTHRIQFVKDNFNAAKMDWFLSSGFTALVAWRAPWHTFPTKGGKYWSAVFKGLQNRAESTSKPSPIAGDTLPSGLNTLYNFANTLKQSGPQHDCKPVFAHFIYFFATIMNAWARQVPVFRISELMTVPDDQLVEYFRSALQGDGDGESAVSTASAQHALQQLPVEEMMNKLSELRRTGRHRHGSRTKKGKLPLPPGANFSAVLFATKEAAFQEMGCDGSLKDLASFCAHSLVGCDRFYDYYGAGAGWLPLH